MPIGSPVVPFMVLGILLTFSCRTITIIYLPHASQGRQNDVSLEGILCGPVWLVAVLACHDNMTRSMTAQSPMASLTAISFFFNCVGEICVRGLQRPLITTFKNSSF